MRYGAIVSWLMATTILATASADDGPIAAKDATRHFKLPPGFNATLFAGEPDIVQPIAFTFDDRGRLWVVENHSYPGWQGEKKDRLLIFEDRDGDGRFDTRKVFLKNGSNLSGIEWGFGGVWLCSTPNLVFVPDANADDVPDGEPIVKLDGWDPTARHNVSSSLAWGPDGWLYGCNGILSNSKLGKPGASEAERTAMNCGVWRYHPTRQVFEVVAHGTTNPWGLDFDEYGQTFITNCVIQHLWHAVPGSRFQRMFGQDFNPHSYDLMATCADHIHWAGGPWTEARGGERHDSHGGGHAHVGAMIYLGDNWPAEYRNHIFTCNIHGNRVNQDILERRGSGYVAHHGSDFLHAGDPWFRGMMVKYGPDGGVYVTDWTDTGECHNYEVVDRTNGRIYKISYGQPKPWTTDLAKKSDQELIALQTHKNEWVVRHARRVLQERHANQKLTRGAKDSLVKMLREQPTATASLRTLWALHAIGHANESLLMELMNSQHDVVRGWAVQLELEDKQASPAALARLVALAKDDSSAWVRLALAAGLQRLPLADRWKIAEGLVAHTEDAKDNNLTLMLWYGIEPLIPSNIEQALDLAERAKILAIRRYVARRAAATAEPAVLAAIVSRMARGDDAFREPVLTGLYDALEGRRRVSTPEGWSALYPQFARSKVDAIRQRGTLLALVFGDRQAVTDLRAIVADTAFPAQVRIEAIGALTQAKTPELTPVLQQLLADPAVRVAALRGLAAYSDASTPRAILSRYASFDAATRQEAISSLSARNQYALALLDAVEKGSIPRADLSAFHIQQLQGLSDSKVSGRLTKIWGSARPTAADRMALIGQYKQRLTPAVLAQADRSRGRAIFAKTCAACHTLFDAGGKIGPELTGSQRSNLDYVLSNVLDPSAIVAREYQMNLIQTTDGRVLSGIIRREDEHSVTVQTATESVLVPKDEVETRQATANSMMPEGLLLSLKEEEIRDLVAYLASPTQSPLPGE